MKASANYLGSSCERIEDVALLTGEGRYLDDLPLPVGTLYAAVVRSPIAHGKIISVDIEPALLIKGVRAILTLKDVQDSSIPAQPQWNQSYWNEEAQDWELPA